MATIANIALAQSLLFASGDSTMVLVAGKAMLAQVSVTTTNPGAVKPTGVLHVQDAAGNNLCDLPLTMPTGVLPTTSPDVPSTASAYTAVVPAEWIKPGLRLTATLSTGPSATLNPRVGGGKSIRLVNVPLQVGSTIGQVASGTALWVQDRFPVAAVAAVNHAVYVSRRVVAAPSNGDWGSAFGTLLGELSDLQNLEGATDDEHYVGFVPDGANGIVGLGYSPGRTVVVADWPFAPNSVRHFVTHELGHNFGLAHAPCGVSDADPDYPYPNAQLGTVGRYVWGFIGSTSTYVDPRPTDAHDVMSYCASDTFSDYNYRKMQVRITPTDAAVKAVNATALAAPTAALQDQLLVSGQIAGDKAQLWPVKAMQGRIRPIAAGPYTLHIKTAQATLDYPFATQKLDHGDGLEHFSLVVPHPGAISGVSITRDGRTLVKAASAAVTTTTTTTATVVDSAAPRARAESVTSVASVQADESGGMLRLSWDASAYAYLTVTWIGARRQTLAQDLEGGSAVLPLGGLPTGGPYEFSLSDGLNSFRVSRPR